MTTQPEFYRTLIDCLPLDIVVLQREEQAEGSSFRLLFANQSSQSSFDIPLHTLLDNNLDNNLDKNPVDGFPNLLAAPLPDLYHEVLTQGAMRTIEDIVYRDARGERHLRFQASPLAHNLILLILQDISAQRQLEEARKKTALALEIYNRKLEASNRELEEFAYVASHDLQEPLRKIMAFGDRLRSKYSVVLGDVGQDYLLRMQNAATRMQTLITDLLNLSRISTRGHPFEPIDLTAIVAGVVKDLEITIEQIGGRIEVDPLPTIAADPLQMRQLFQNLISNGLKFRQADRAPILSIHSKVEASEDAAYPRYSLFVIDNGIGFDEKYAERIFQPFQRLHGFQQYEGTGMGLAICRRIVERHGGTIQAKGEPGMGATFIISLPAL
jgi:signal transduction histidine kinase